MFLRLALLTAILTTSCSSGPGGKGSSPAPANPEEKDPGKEEVITDVLSARPDNPSCVAFAKPNDGAEVKLERRFSSTEFPEIIGFYQAPNDRFYAVRRKGQIQTFTKSDASDQRMFLDISSSINSGPGEAGLLGMAWHPTKKDEFYLSYTVGSGSSPANVRSVIARFKSSDGITATNSPEILLTLDQPYDNHNGGHIAFGPDGYLYIAFGDGGSGGDPQNRAQNLDSLFGKILRIDVNGQKPYAVPSDNPFVGQSGRKPEIWAYGLRNPWRFQFDRATGDLWLGDVGQDKWEEVDRVVKGGNYGWKIKEGAACFNSASCSQGNLVDPVAVYDHSEGNSITGGFVYRGKAIPSLIGVYLYADFGTGKIWGLYPDANGVLSPKLLLTPGFNISSFAEDKDGELYVLEYGGKIHRIASTPATNPVFAPAQLSKTGCFDAKNSMKPVEGLIPYEVNSPLWSDNTDKGRWMGLPNGEKITVKDDGRFEFPKGTVLVKDFELADKLIETRLFVHHDDGSWAGYTYAWNTEGTDAELVPNGLNKKFGDQVWTYPSQGQCLQCHNANAGYSLGLTLAQLEKKIGSNKDTNQLDVYEKIGLFQSELPKKRSALPVPLETKDNALAARSYMDANCAFCHRPGGTGGGNLDLRFTTNFKDTGMCDKTPGSGDLGINNARILAPKDSGRSILYERMSSRGAQQMPPLASSVPDTKITKVVDAWINSIESCP